MLSRLTVFITCCFASLVANANAAPVTVGKSEAVAEARRDPGSGLCGSVIKFTNPPGPLSTIDEAITLLDKPPSDPRVAGRVARLFQNMNFTVGPGSEGDFYPPRQNEETFPYCQDLRADPMAADDDDIAMRLRGYLNVPSTLQGLPQTFVVRCDDACVLRIGKSRQLVTEANDKSPSLTGRRARQVAFAAPGLYPIELVYFQNATTGYLEWSRAPMSLFAIDDTAVDDTAWNQNMASFKPAGGAELYSAVIGNNSSCIECGAAGQDCTSGNYCSDGLCQSCNLPEHCGASCQKCPGDRALCSAGKCVQCTSDAMCPLGSLCDITTGTCGLPNCTNSGPCGCRPEGFCEPLPVPCTIDTNCQADQICACSDYGASCSVKVCIVPPTPCVDDSACAAYYHCDTTAQICRLNERFQYQGGLAGCGMSPSSPDGGSGLLWLLAPLLFGSWRGRHGPGLRRRLRLSPFAVFSPMLAAMLVSRFEPGGRGIRAVFRPLRNWSVGQRGT